MEGRKVGMKEEKNEGTVVIMRIRLAKVEQKDYSALLASISTVCLIKDQFRFIWVNVRDGLEGL